MNKFNIQMKYVVKTIALTLLILVPIVIFYSMANGIVDNAPYIAGWVTEIARKMRVAGTVTNLLSVIFGMIIGTVINQYDRKMMEELEGAK